MKTLRLVCLATTLTLFACGAPESKSKACTKTSCPATQTCNPNTGRCDGAGTDGGPVSDGGAGVHCTATTGCGGNTPYCDIAAMGGNGTCVTCTGSQGCSAPTPYCLTGAPGACVQCRTTDDCVSPGMICDGATRTCIVPPADGGTDGEDAGFTCTSTSGCSGPTPTCDTSAMGGRGSCVTCTATQGCTSPTPYCLTGAPGGACVQCRNTSDCAASGMICDGATRTCIVPAFDGGTDGGGGGGTSADAGFPFCVPRDGGAPPCSTECSNGFHCVNGSCQLNGANGPVQVTLRWNTQEDLDLHLDEPTDGGACEIYFGDPNRNLGAGGSPSSCGAQGSLDLDSEASCPFTPDYVEVENIIYPPGLAAPSGTYVIRVAHFMNCNIALAAVPFQVEVRNNGVVSGYCGVFVPTDLDWNSSASTGGGRRVMTFVVP